LEKQKPKDSNWINSVLRGNPDYYPPTSPKRGKKGRKALLQQPKNQAQEVFLSLMLKIDLFISKGSLERISSDKLFGKGKKKLPKIKNAL
jgi:hypothetical protein